MRRGAAGGRAPRGWALLAEHLAPRRRALARVAAWSVVESLPALTSGILVAHALDRGFLRGRPVEGLGWLSLLGVALGCSAFAVRRLYPWLAETVEPLRDSLVRDLVAAVVFRGVSEPRDPDTAAVAQLTEQVETVRQLVSSLLRSMRQVGFAIIASLVGLTALAPVVALLVAPPLFLALALYAASLRSLAVRQRAVVLAGEAVPQAAGVVLAGLRDVVACGAERRAATMAGDPIDRQAEAERALARAGAVRTLVVVIGAQLPIVALLLAAPWLVSQQGLSIGAVAGAITYLITSLEPALRALVHMTGTWGLHLGVVLNRLAETCALPVSPTALPVPAHGRLALDGHDLRVDGVTFSYGPHADPVVADLSLQLRHGEHLAIVGPSGIGKSTLANLLAGLLRPQHGQVRLGGIPLEDLEETSLRRAIALIPQEAYVCAGTLRDNLVYLRTDASKDALDHAVEAVGLRSTVERLGGCDALIGAGGVALSAGERQLVALARTYLSPAAIVLLDEATCHLDPVAEAIAEQALATQGRTLVVIAHRISSALRADRILVMDGAVPRLGTHDSLLATSPLYADLVGHWQQETPSVRT